MKQRFYLLCLSVLVGCLMLIAALPITPTLAQSSTPHATFPPTNTKRVPTVATIPPTNTKRAAATAAPTGTPTVVTPTASATLSSETVSIPAKVCANCLRVRFRATPGTAGEVLDFLDDTTQLTILGRSDDAQWLKAKILIVGNNEKNVEGSIGWLAVEFVRLQSGDKFDSAALNDLPVLDIAVAASPTPTSSVGIPGFLSHVSSKSRQIFLKGQQLGNRANVFSRVGDSMTASAYFLTPFGAGNYDLGSYGQLSTTISFFSQVNARAGNSFVNPSLAANGGWSSDSLLLGGLTGQAMCGGETPLVCEYKQVKPAVALIMIGTNDSGSGTTDWFEGNLRQIVETSIDMGVIPVLSTIPPKPFSDDQMARAKAFNQVIRSIATQYDVPLWDYFMAMDALPDKGISSDHLHASVPPGGKSGFLTPENLQYGYTIRNLEALQVLDVLRRLVLY